MHRNVVLELYVALWTASQPNSKIFMIVVCLVSFPKIHIWRFMISKFLLWWSTRDSIFLHVFVKLKVSFDNSISERFSQGLL